MLAVTQKQPKATTFSGGMLWGDLCNLDGEWDHVSILETRGMLYTSTRSSCSLTSVNHENQMLLTKSDAIAIIPTLLSYFLLFYYL